VLLPGMDGTGTLFEPFCRALGGSVPTVVINYPTDERLSYEELENLALRALPTHGVHVLLAESFSGPIAINLASRKAAGLRGVILCASFAKSPGPEWLRWIARSCLVRVGLRPALLRTFLMGPECPSSLVAAVSEAIRSVEPAVLARRLQEVLRVDVTRSLQACGVPLVYVVGTGDRLLGNRGLKLIKAVKPEVTCLSVDGPHLQLQCRPHEVAQAVQHLLHGWLAS
jgi:pimeloyl-ACP methyl ester carboxylesterase